jgi:hypothetical protein
MRKEIEENGARKIKANRSNDTRDNDEQILGWQQIE